MCVTGKHYKWQTRWTVDPATGVCTHDSGLKVRVEPGGAGAEALNWPEIERELAKKHGHNAAAMGQRLLREAREVFNDPRRRPDV
jgi:hypothetical protein